jgi:hypothetical protein
MVHRDRVGVRGRDKSDEGISLMKTLTNLPLLHCPIYDGRSVQMTSASSTITRQRTARILPTTTELSSRRFSSSDTPGMVAISKHSRIPPPIARSVHDVLGKVQFRLHAGHSAFEIVRAHERERTPVIPKIAQHMMIAITLNLGIFR